MNRIELLKQYLEQQPDDSFLRHALALEYVKIENDTDAETLFRAVLEDDPEYVGSYYHLGKLLERKGDKENAMATYEAGKIIAKKQEENRTFNELQGALDDLIDW